MQDRPLDLSLEEKVLNASPEQLQAMLYEAAIRFAQQGRRALERKDPAAAAEALSRSQAVLEELLSGLRPDVDSAICHSFGALYHFCIRKLREASDASSAEPINDALLILDHLRRTWLMVCERINEEQNQSVGV